MAALACCLALFAADARAGVGGVGTAPTAPAPAPTAQVPAGTMVFPVRGPHAYWAGLGDGRGHQGADVGAKCGTPLVAVGAGKLAISKYHSRAGNYAVLDLKGLDYDVAYMHMTEPTLLKVGQAVAPGQLIGYVGDTGNADGCHLHFEVWEGVYYGGGAPVDPIPFLKSLERKRVKRVP